MKVNYQGSHPAGAEHRSGNRSANILTDAAGPFHLRGPGRGTVNIFAHGVGENREGTYRAAKDVRLTAGATAEVAIELIRGVEVEGSVVEHGTGKPVEGAQVGVYGPSRPRTTAMTTMVATDARGRYRYRLPAGETYFYIARPPSGFMYQPGAGFGDRTVTIPDGDAKYEIPPFEVAAAITVRGRVVDAVGSPIAGATVVGVCEGGTCRPFGGTEAVTDARGEFRLPPTLNNIVPVGKAARLLVRLRGGAEHEAAAVPGPDGAVTLRLPVAVDPPKGVEGPREVAPDELAGVVVDADGKPIEGAEVDARTWFPGHEAKSDAKGAFRIGNLDKNRKVEVVIRKPGYTPQLFRTQPPGTPGRTAANLRQARRRWVIAGGGPPRQWPGVRPVADGRGGPVPRQGPPHPPGRAICARATGPTARSAAATAPSDVEIGTRLVFVRVASRQPSSVGFSEGRPAPT